MANRHTKRYLTFPNIREIQIKTKMRHHFTPVRMASKRSQITNVGKDVKKREPFWWECKLVWPLWKTVRRFHKKLKIELPYDPAVPLLGIYLKNVKTLIWKDICTPMFTAVLFTIAKIWKQPKCPSTYEWIKNMWYIYTMEYYSVIKREWTFAICNNMDGLGGYYA